MMNNKNTYRSKHEAAFDDLLQEMDITIKLLPNRKSPGPNNISNEMLKKYRP